MRTLALIVTVAGLWACGGMTKDQAERQLDQMVMLYKDNRPKFVVQKQELEQGNCSRATMLRQAADDRAKTAAMSPENTETVTMVQMEMQQAEKTCLSH